MAVEERVTSVGSDGSRCGSCTALGRAVLAGKWVSVCARGSGVRSMTAFFRVKCAVANAFVESKRPEAELYQLAEDRMRPFCGATVLRKRGGRCNDRL